MAFRVASPQSGHHAQKFVQPGLFDPLQVRFSPDNQAIMATAGNTMRVLSCVLCVDSAELSVLAESRVTRSLTARERKAYLTEVQ
jgi:hypothetical protein